MIVWNEWVKLLPNALNGVAVAMLALGMLAPIAKILFEGGPETNALMLVEWSLGAIIIHGIASWVLQDLKE